MQHNQHTEHGDQNHYLRLVGMIVLSFISMYVLMYSMAHSFADVYNSLNQVYMAGLMASPMVLIELIVMRAMYADRRQNAIFAAVAVILGILCFVGIRRQAAIGDRQFLRSQPRACPRRADRSPPD